MKLRRTNPFIAAVVFTMTACATSYAVPVTQTWDNGFGNATWDTTTHTNWDAGSAWTNDNDAVFSATGMPITIDAGGVSANSLSFTTLGYTISGGTLMLSGVSTVTAAADATIDSVIDGTTGLIKDGAGMLTLTAANIYLGGTTITAGTLSFATGSLSTDPITMNGGILQWATGNTEDVTASASLTMVNAKTATLDTNGNDVLLDNNIGSSTTASLTKIGAGKLTLTGANTYTGVTTLTAGTLSVDAIGLGGTSNNIGAATAAAGNLVFDGGTLQYTYNGLEEITNRAFTINTGKTAVFDISDVAGKLNISGASANTNGSLSKTGPGTLTLSGANLYTGKTTINAGTLAIAADTGLGTAPGAAVADQLTLNGGALKVTANSVTLSANRGVTLGVSGGTFDFSGRGIGESFTVGGVITGTGALTLKSSGDMSANGGGGAGMGIRLNQATNTNIGDVTITSGLVTYANNLSFGDAANKIILNGGGLLDQNNNIALSRTIDVQAGGGTFRGWGSVNVTWSSAITGSGAINRTDGGTIVLSGDLSGYGGAFNNQGGTTTISGTGAATGNWTVSGGALRIGNGGTTGDLNTGALVNNSYLQFYRSGTYSTSKNITGTGTIGILASGASNSLTFSGSLTANTLNFDRPGSESMTVTLSGSGANSINNFTSSQDGHGTLLLAKDVGVNALSGNVYVGNGYASRVTVQLGANEQIANTSTLYVGGYTYHYGGFGRFELMGYNETVAGIADGATDRPGQYVVRNNAATASTLSLAGTGAYSYSNTMNNGAAGLLNIDKTGSGTQTFVGGGITYSGATNLTGGTLKLSDVGAGFASAIAVGASTTLELNSTNTAVDSMRFNGGNITGTGTITKTGVGWVMYQGATVMQNFSGLVDIQQGTFGSAYATGLIGKDGSTMTVNVGASTLFDLRGSGVNAAKIDKLTGTGVVGTTHSVASTLTLGTAGGTSQFDGVIKGNGTSGGGDTSNPNNAVISLAKVGAGTVTLTGNNTFTGAVTVTGGTLNLSGNNLFTGAVTINGGTLILGGTNVYTVGTTLTSGTLQLDGTGSLGLGGTYAGAITGGGNFTKNSTGIQYLTGANNYTGLTTVNAGTLVTRSVGPNGGLNVGAAGNFIYRPVAAGPLTLGTGSITLVNGSRVGTVLAGTVGQSAITSTGVASTTGTVTLDISGIGAITPDTGTHNLLTAGSGLAGAAYVIGNITNATNFTVTNLQYGSGTAVTVDVTAATPLTAAYWKGGLAGNPGTWASTNGITASNWAVDAAGTATPLTPGAGATVIFSATGATDQGAMVLGDNVSVAGAVFNDASAVTLGADLYTLTLGTGGITVNSGAGQVTLNGALTTGGAQNWVNLSGNPLIISGPVNGTAGAVTLTTGTLKSGSTSAFGNTGTNGLALVLANTAGVGFDITGFNTTVGSIAGGGTLGGNITFGAATLTAGGNNASTTYSGVLSGTGGGLTKVGTGTLTLGGSTANTYTGTTTLSGGILMLSKGSDNMAAVGGPVTMINNEGIYLAPSKNNAFASGSVLTLSGGSGNSRFEMLGTTQTLAGIVNDGSGRGVIQTRENGALALVGPISTLILNGTGTYSFNGYLRNSGGILALVKNGTGTQTLSGGNVRGYGGGTIVNQGTLALGSQNNGNSTVWGTVTINASGTLDCIVANSFGYNANGLGMLNINGGTVTTSTNAHNHFYKDSGSFPINMTGGILRLGGDASLTGNSNQFRNAPINVSSASTTTAQVLGFTANATIALRDSSTQIFNVGDGTQALDLLVDVIVSQNGTACNVLKTGSGTMSMTKTNGYSGTTTVNAGTLTLDYTATNTTKLSDTAALVLGGGTLDLKGGSHTEIVGSTTLTAGTASTVTRSSGTGVLQMNTITPGAGATVSFTADSIATTDNTNNASGILGGWATLGDTWAINSTNAADGLITAYAGGYTDVDRLGGTIVDGTATLVRIIEAGVSGDITMAAAGTTNISTLTEAAALAGPAVVDLTGNVLRLGTSGGILVPSAGTALTFNAGTLTAGGGAVDVAGGIDVTNLSAAAVTINSVIANNGTGAVTLTKSGTGPMTIAGVNTYTGGTIINGGTVTMSGTGTLGNTNNPLTLNGGTLDLNATTQGVGSFNGAGGTLTNTGAAATFTLGNNNTTGEFSGVVAGATALSKIGTGTITLSGGTSNTYTGATTLGGTGYMYLNKTGGAVAVPGDIYMSASGTRSLLSAAQDNQFGATSVMRFTVTPGDTRFELKGTTQTLAGLESTGFAGTYAAIQHNELGVGSVIDDVSTLILNVTGSYTFGNAAGTAVIRDQGGIVELIKNGTGTQILNGPGITYSGGTTINGGVLELGGGSNVGRGVMMINNTGTLRLASQDASDSLGLITINPGGVMTASANWQWITGGLRMNGGEMAATVAGHGNYGNYLMDTRGVFEIRGAQKSTMSADLRFFNVNRTIDVAQTGDPSGTDFLVTGALRHIHGLYWGFATKIGDGTMELTNANNSIGSLTVSAGKVIFKDQMAGMDNGGIINNSLVDANMGTGITTTFANVISGSSAGIFNKLGVGAVTLTNQNTSTGLFKVSAGTLTLGHATNTLANTAQLEVAGGTLAIGANSDTVGAVTLTSGSITGTGVLTGTSFAVQSGTVSAILAGTSAALTKTTGGTVILSNANTYTGTTTINGGTLQLGDGTTNGSVAGNIVNTAALVVNTVGTQTIANAISGSGGTLSKTGLGKLNLPGANSYTGATTVNNGTLNVTGSLTSAVTVVSGATLAGQGGSTSSSLTLDSTSVITAVPGVAGPGNAFRAAGVVTAAAMVTVKVEGYVPTLGTTTYDVLGYGTTPGTANFSVGSFHAGAATVNDDVTNSKITLDLTNATRTWNSASSNWDVMTTTAWQEGDFLYGQGDLVVFNDTGTGGGGARGVSLNAAVTPGNVSFNNTTSTYTVSGAGSIGGATALTKAGTGLVDLSNLNNTYSGGTTVTGGTLSASIGTGAGAKTNFGTGTVSVTGSTLQMFAGSTGNGMSLANSLALDNATLISQDAVITYSGGISLTGTNTVNVVYGGKNAIFSNVVTGAGGITKTGPGDLIFTGANDYSGTTTISAGTLNVGNGGATGTLGSGDVVNNSALNLNRTGTYTASNTISGTGPVYIRGGGATTLAGTVANSFTGNLDVYEATVILGKTAGVNALGGNISIGSTASYGNNNGGSILKLAASDQIPDAATVNMYDGHYGGDSRFLLMGNNETIGGLYSNLYYIAAAVIQNGGATNSTLTLNVTSGSIQFGVKGGYYGSNQYFQDGSTGTLSLVKNGAGTQILGGTGEQYTHLQHTGTTTLNAGIVRLIQADHNTSATTLAGGTLDVQGSTVNAALSGTTGSVTITGGTNSNFGGTSGAKTYSVDTTISGNSTLTQTATNSLSAASLHNIGTGSTLAVGAFAGSVKALTGAGSVVIGTSATGLTIADGSGQTFSGIISGTGKLIKNGGGTQILTGANTYTGGTQVNGTGSILIRTAPSVTALNSALTVYSSGTFVYQATAPNPLNLGTGIIDLQDCTIGTSLGGTVGQSAITSSVAANSAGNVTVDIYGISTGTTDTGTHNLITAASGLNNATYALGNVYNATNFTITGALTQSDTAVSIDVATVAAPTDRYWKGGFSGAAGKWAISNGTTLSNWATDMGGTDTSLVPGAGTTVHISATTASNQAAMTLGANMSVLGIVVDDTAAVTLNNDLNTLTIGTGGITVNSGAGAVILASPIILGGAQSWSNASVTNPLAVTGNVSGANGLTKGGAGTLSLSGVNSYTGASTVNGGKLQVSSLTAIPSSTALVIADAAGANFDITGYNTAVGSIAGGGTTGGEIILGAAALTTGSANTTTTYSGVISGTGTLTKVGTGTLTLDGSVANTYTGLTAVNNGVLSLGKTGGAKAIGGNLTFDNNLSPDVYTTVDNQFAPGSVVSFVTDAGDHGRLELLGTTQTVAGIQTVGYTGQRGVIQNREMGPVNTGTSTLVLNGSGTYSYGGYLRNSSGTLALTYSGTGTQTLVGTQITYTGATSVTGAGRLILSNTTGYNSATTIGTGATVEVALTTDWTVGSGLSFAGLGTLVKSGANTLTLGGNDYSTAMNLGTGGLIDIQGGKIKLDYGYNKTSWNANLADMNIVSGATFDLWDYGQSAGAFVKIDALNGAGLINRGISGTTTGGLQIGVDNGSGSFSGVIANGTGTSTVSITKSGTGTQTLSGVNTYTGVTTLTGGVLSVATIGNGGVSGNLGAAAVAATNLVFNGGTLQYTGTTAETNRNFTINATKTATVDVTESGTRLTVSGASVATDGALTKIGAGTLLLSGTNLHTGTTAVNAGTLLLTGSVAGPATVGTTGTLAGSGTVTGTTTVATTGILSPGDGSAAALNFSDNVTLQSGSNYAVDVTGTNASDKIVLASTKVLDASGTITLTESGHTFTAGDDYDIADTDTTITGTPAILPATPGVGLVWDTTTFATDGHIKVVSAVTNTYDSWADAYGLVGGDKLPTADPDNDGIPNAVEMVLGGDPANGMDVAMLPTIELVTDPTDSPAVAAGDYLLFTYRRTDRSVDSLVTSACETSTTLVAPWDTAVNGVDGVIVRETNDNFTAVTAPPGAETEIDEVRVYVPRGANTELFGRLNVVVPEP